ncbi:hypothetical protein [Dehalococcoides mccartyi]|uniref:hypothetical protein n=1 Tax=Dehalococcoides mccartyi TaxID=61435 RepID=UPI000780486A|nr:hypothetical protein [Dehalococcoides mccartyi]
MSKKVTMMDRVKGMFKKSVKPRRMRRSKIRDLLRCTFCEGCNSMSYVTELGPRFVICQNSGSDHYGHILDGKLHTCRLHSSAPKKVKDQMKLDLKG